MSETAAAEFSWAAYILFEWIHVAFSFFFFSCAAPQTTIWRYRVQLLCFLNNNTQVWKKLTRSGTRLDAEGARWSRSVPFPCQSVGSCLLFQIVTQPHYLESLLHLPSSCSLHYTLNSKLSFEALSFCLLFLMFALITSTCAFREPSCNSVSLNGRSVRLLVWSWAVCHELVLLWWL